MDLPLSEPTGEITQIRTEQWAKEERARIGEERFQT